MQLLVFVIRLVLKKIIEENSLEGQELQFLKARVDFYLKILYRSSINFHWI